MNKWTWSNDGKTFTFSIDGLSIEEGQVVGSWKASGNTLMFQYKNYVVWSL